MTENISPNYLNTEEWANGLTHGLATLVSIVGLVFMIIFATRCGDIYHVISASIYGTTLILLYASSTLYHLSPTSPLKTIFQQIDHAMIYLLIAGTYTPYTLVNLRGPWGWSLFGTVWGLALTGLLLELLLPRRIRWLSLTLYLALGWLIVIAVKPLVENLAPRGLILLITGGLFYSFGIIFYVWKSLHFQHTIWHLFVMGGSLCHFFSIYFYVLPFYG